MTIWVCLLRGINVGGKNKLPMTELKRMLAKLGATGARTYIQSGNAVFSAVLDRDEFTDLLEREILERQGFRPRVTLIEACDLRAARAEFPFNAAIEDPKTGHIWVCANPPPAPDLGQLQELAGPGERFVLQGRFFMLHAPEGIGRSKLAANVERALGVPATARNLNTVAALCDMAEAFEDED